MRDIGSQGLPGHRRAVVLLQRKVIHRELAGIELQVERLAPVSHELATRIQAAMVHRAFSIGGASATSGCRPTPFNVAWPVKRLALMTRAPSICRVPPASP